MIRYLIRGSVTQLNPRGVGLVAREPSGRIWTGTNERHCLWAGAMSRGTTSLGKGLILSGVGGIGSINSGGGASKAIECKYQCLY